MRLGLAAAALALASCGSGTAAGPASGARTFRMGFSMTPPRLTIPEVLRTIDEETPHADGALMNVEPPWPALLADSSPAFLVRRDQLPVAQRYRQKGFPIVATVDVGNGLDRSAESPKLVSLGRSIREPAVQRAYAEWVAALDSVVRPDWLALAMETNLIRSQSPAAVYAAVVAMTNAAAAERRAHGTTARLMVTVQVEAAWGRLGGAADTKFVGVARDRADFPFVQALGLSSYPYLGGWPTPESLPDDYYARLDADAPIPMLVSEGGWPSASAGGVQSSPEMQARYVRRQARLAANAGLVGVYQITYADLDVASYGASGTILPLFAALGLVDVNYRAKPALAAWDSVRGVPLK